MREAFEDAIRAKTRWGRCDFSSTVACSARQRVGEGGRIRWIGDSGNSARSGSVAVVERGSARVSLGTKVEADASADAGLLAGK